MRKIILFCQILLVLNISYACNAETESSKIELAVEVFLRSVSSCDVDAEIENVTRVAESDFDYSRTLPEILPNDLQILAMVHICNGEDWYYLWLRQSGNEYEVISYTSFSQPE